MSNTIKPMTLGELKQHIFIFENEYPHVDINKIPVYVGDDEELNGIHEAYLFETDNWQSDYESLIRSIPGTKYKGKFALIS